MSTALLVAQKRRAASRGRHPQRFRARLHPPETIAFEDLVRCGGDPGADPVGRMRSEGQDYEVQVRDVKLFRFKV